MNEYQITNFMECPRCGLDGLERLATHSHCGLCNYSPDLDCEPESTCVPDWAIKALLEADQEIVQGQFVKAPAA